MPFKRPTLAQLITQFQSGLNAKLPGADARLKRSILNVIAAVSAGLVNGTYGYLDYLANNAFAQNADEFHLVRLGQMYGLAPTPAVPASGTALFTGTTGTPVPSGTVLQDSGQNLYVTTATVALGAGSTSIPVTAQFGGDDGNLEAGSPLTLTTAIAGVNANATVDSSGFAGGVDAEDIGTTFRARVIARIQTPPGGSGTAADYEKWTRAALPDITRVTISGALRGAGTVDARFVCDGRADPIPLSGDLAIVQAALEANAPLTDVAGIEAIAPIAVHVDYTLPVSRFATADQQASAIAALTDMHANLLIGAGLSLQTNAIPALAAAKGVSSVSSLLTTPAADIAPDATKVLLLGNVIFA